MKKELEEQLKDEISNIFSLGRTDWTGLQAGRIRILEIMQGYDKIVISDFLQKVREECVKNVGPADISTCEECINWEDCEVNISICFEGSTKFLLPHEWNDGEVKAFIEKALEEKS